MTLLYQILRYLIVQYLGELHIFYFDSDCIDTLLFLELGLNWTIWTRQDMHSPTKFHQSVINFVWPISSLLIKPHKVHRIIHQTHLISTNFIHYFIIKVKTSWGWALPSSEQLKLATISSKLGWAVTKNILALRDEISSYY